MKFPICSHSGLSFIHKGDGFNIVNFIQIMTYVFRHPYRFGVIVVMIKCLFDGLIHVASVPSAEIDRHIALYYAFGFTSWFRIHNRPRRSNVGPQRSTATLS